MRYYVFYFFLVCILQAVVAALFMNIYIVGLNQLFDIEIDKVSSSKNFVEPSHIILRKKLMCLSCVNAQFQAQFYSKVEFASLFIRFLITCNALFIDPVCTYLSG